MTARQLLLYICILSVLLLNISCSSTSSTVGGWLNLDTDLKISFKVEADINPDENQRPSPLFIRMYELKSAKQFERADFVSLYERDKEILGADILNTQRLKRLTPGENSDNNFVLNKHTQYVGLFAEFLQFRNSGFKIVIPVVRQNILRSSAEIHVSGNSIIDMDRSAKDVGYKN